MDHLRIHLDCRSGIIKHVIWVSRWMKCYVIECLLRYPMVTHIPKRHCLINPLEPGLAPVCTTNPCRPSYFMWVQARAQLGKKESGRIHHSEIQWLGGRCQTLFVCPVPEPSCVGSAVNTCPVGSLGRRQIILAPSTSHLGTRLIGNRWGYFLPHVVL